MTISFPGDLLLRRENGSLLPTKTQYQTGRDSSFVLPLVKESRPQVVDLNDAYRTLKQPAGRIEYLLKLEGVAPKNEHEASRQVPPGLLEEVFALNEELDEIRALRQAQGVPSDESRDGAPAVKWSARLARAREPIEAKRVEHEAQLQELAERWDALVDRGAGDAERRAVLEALRDRFLERNYITNLLAGIERELNS